MNQADFQFKIVTLDEAVLRCQNWKGLGEKVVFTNGVFDLIHPGHIFYLSEAKLLGTKLIVGINSDHSARQLSKGEGRPINNEKARSLVAAGLESVDLVVIFEESTPEKLIEAVTPNMLVKGGDYTIDQIVGANHVITNGGEVRSLKFVEGYSTTAIEQKILKTGLEK